MDNKVLTLKQTPEAQRAVEEYLVGVGKAMSRAEATPIIEEIEGSQYVFFRGEYRRVKPAEPEEEQQPDVFDAFSLGGLVDFIKADIDGIFSDQAHKCTVRVADTGLVEVLTPVSGYYKHRYVVARCKAMVPQIPFDRYMDAESFQIMVQTRFQDDDNRKMVLKLSGSLRSEQSTQTADDGVSQKVTINQGVATAADVIVKNPVELVPLRTFYEVEQPASPFVLRFNECANVALFEGDGGAWKLKAVDNVRAWLSAELVLCNVVVIA